MYRLLNHENKKGFTIAELLIVIVLIGFMVRMMLNINFINSGEKENKDRLVSKITNILKTERSNAALWRWFKDPLDPTKIINFDYSEIAISKTNLTVKYYKKNPVLPDTEIWVGESLISPFFWRTEYTISEINAMNNDLAKTTCVITTAKVTFDSNLNKMTLWGTWLWACTSPVGLILKITYVTSDATIFFDTRTGMIQTN